MRNKFFALSALFIVLTLFVSCGKSKAEKNIELLKNGTLEGYENQSIEDAVLNTFKNPIYSYSEKEDGSSYVTLEGLVNGEDLARNFIANYPEATQIIEELNVDEEEFIDVLSENSKDEKIIIVFKINENKTFNINLAIEDTTILKDEEAVPFAKLFIYANFKELM